MTWTQTTITLKDAAGNNQPLVAYTDGTNYSLAHPLLDATGAVVAPATAGNQATGNASLTAIAANTANLPAKGAATSANSVPVVLASDQAALPLPTGAATAAKQDAGNASLAAIATNTSGSATAANQTAANASLATLAANSGTQATAANQATGNTSLASLSTALGAPTDAAASADTGTFGLIALVKRSLTTLASVLAACQAATPAGTNLMGKVGIDQTTPGTTNGVQLTAALPAGANAIGSVSVAANTAGGTSTYAATGGTGNALLTAAAVAVKASAGNLYGFDFVNTGASAAYVQFFDLATGSVTLGTTAPKLSKWVPAGGAWEEKFTDEAKVSFATAITVAATTTPTGSAAPSTGVLANILFK